MFIARIIQWSLRGSKWHTVWWRIFSLCPSCGYLMAAKQPSRKFANFTTPTISSTYKTGWLLTLSQLSSNIPSTKPKPHKLKNSMRCTKSTHPLTALVLMVCITFVSLPLEVASMLPTWSSQENLILLLIGEEVITTRKNQKLVVFAMSTI